MDDLILGHLLDRFQNVALGSFHPHQQGLAFVGMRCCNSRCNSNHDGEDYESGFQTESNHACEVFTSRRDRICAHGVG